MRFLAAFALFAGLLETVPARSESVCEEPWSVEVNPPPTERVSTIEIEGHKANVLLPPGYAAPGNTRRYPVLYILHGGGWSEDQGVATYLAFTDIIELTEAEQGVIVVMPYGGMFGMYGDWLDGSQAWESYHLNTVVPYVDTHYRTIADGRHRAVVGESLGGLGAAKYAAKHPDMFAAVGAFLGITDIRLDGAESAALKPAGSLWGLCVGGDGSGLYGPEEIDWANNNPTDLAMNFRGTTLYVSASGRVGTPCDPADLRRAEQGYPVLGAADRQINERFTAALRAAGVAHTSDLRDCGWHDWPEVNESLHRFWPLMLDALGSPQPDSFDYRSADPVFEARGWTFAAAPDRAKEFLDATDVSCGGLGLTGSGVTRVTTAPCFAPGGAVRVSDVDGNRVATADTAGRVTFDVDLGSPHTFAQFTPQASALEAAGGYFRSRSVALAAL